jgi:hypothetical protein
LALGWPDPVAARPDLVKDADGEQRRQRRSWMGSAGLRMGSRACPWVFLIFYSINCGGQTTVSKNSPFTVTFVSRRLQKPPWLIIFASFR